MNQHISVATIDSPEFVNITSISPLVSKCEIKVLYVGENRNRSLITKEVATEMAQTLPGVPIVGRYIHDKEDFGDHGDQIVIENGEVKFNKLTVPYGFVAPDAKVWFKKFEERDESNNPIIREYLMTEGYLWTKQYEEAKRVITEGNPQSMELDEDSLKGYWSDSNKYGVSFFIISDAMFSKLCILGDDVEPCFEGAAVTAPDISTNFSNDNFIPTLFSMMKELKDILSNKGGDSMEKEMNVVSEENLDVQDNSEQEVVSEFQNITEDENSEVETEFKKDDKEEKEEAPADDEKPAEKKDEESEKEAPAADDEDKEEDKKKKYELLETELSELKEKFSLMETEYNELLAFKKNVEDKEKDELIASFYMLSDEDKADVIANKANYSLKEIKAELSMICVDKKVNFATVEEEEQPITSFNLHDNEADVLPAWLKAVVEKKKERNSLD